MKKEVEDLKTVQEEIKDVLIKLQEGYTKRDINLIDEYVDPLISTDSNVFAVGTADDEWCFGWKEVKELIESDWEYWGDLVFDIENMVFSTQGDTAWLITRASVSYEFGESQETYERYLDACKDFLENKDEDKDLSSLSKITKINYLLASLMGNRKESKRAYKWPARFSGVLVKVEEKWVFKYMQFSMTNPSRYPDIRFINEDEYKEKFKDLKAKMLIFKENCISTETKDIEELLINFQKVYLENTYSTKDILTNFFERREDVLLVGPEEMWHKGESEVREFIQDNRRKWDQMSIGIDEAIISINDDVAWVTTNGLARKRLSIEDACNREIDIIKGIFNYNISGRDKVFKIQRDISILLKEISKGEEFFWPFRLEGVLLKKDGRWLIHTLQISYPFMMILEGKYD
ncbi:hypothetical protein GOQ27_08595 [Clostridium sp. D2Q-11]|uniref:SnoaL-like domain-containing protein n=1 Tax=Anaeromonas frigoriresistens TaxID=2683708 RepID=A0A942Z949_9FIRM|nr:nuclear transport factor 2 family protein [Anaeromonas frigoriresistens]MBS4538520.1 hypothetical protein [Anaeromonas frigoriresistens]